MKVMAILMWTYLVIDVPWTVPIDCMSHFHEEIVMMSNMINTLYNNKYTKMAREASRVD
jgi:hypothetical protein